MIGKQKAPMRYSCVVSHLLHTVYLSMHTRSVGSVSNNVRVSGLLLDMLESHVRLTKNRILIIPEGSFVTDLRPKLPTLWYPKSLTIKEYGKVAIYLAEVPYRYKALMLLGLAQPKALVVFNKIEYLPSRILTTPAIDPRFPNPYTPFDPEHSLKIGYSKIY